MTTRGAPMVMVLLVSVFCLQGFAAGRVFSRPESSTTEDEIVHAVRSLSLSGLPQDAPQKQKDVEGLGFAKACVKGRLLGCYIRVDSSSYEEFEGSEFECERCEDQIELCRHTLGGHERALQFWKDESARVSQSDATPDPYTQSIVLESLRKMQERERSCSDLRRKIALLEGQMSVLQEHKTMVVRQILTKTFETNPYLCPKDSTALLRQVRAGLKPLLEKSGVVLKTQNLVNAFCQGFFSDVSADMKKLIIQNTGRVLSDEVYAELSAMMYRADFVVPSMLRLLCRFMVDRGDFSWKFVAGAMIASFNTLERGCIAAGRSVSASESQALLLGKCFWSHIFEVMERGGVCVRRLRDKPSIGSTYPA